MLNEGKSFNAICKDTHSSKTTVSIYKVSIRSTPYCISQKNIVPLHGGIISLILRQKNAI